MDQRDDRVRTGGLGNTGCRIFLAGASGAIGRRLASLLVKAGHAVTGTTRSADKVPALEAAGVVAAIVDVFDADALARAVAAARPRVIIHQLTDLPREPDPAALEAALERNARLRIEGTRNLVKAALAAGAVRLIAQSIAFAYAPGPEPHREADPLDLGAGGARAVTIEGVWTLEDLVTATAGIDGIVLRYGRLYGPGTWTPIAKGRAPVHVDAAAWAALLAVARGAPGGAYNIAEDDGAVAIDKARAQLGWEPSYRIAE